MTTLVTIEWSNSVWLNRTQFVRRNAKKPTYAGAARMIAKHISGKSDDGRIYKPSEITVHRIEESVYA